MACNELATKTPRFACGLHCGVCSLQEVVQSLRAPFASQVRATKTPAWAECKAGGPLCEPIARYVSRVQSRQYWQATCKLQGPRFATGLHRASHSFAYGLQCVPTDLHVLCIASPTVCMRIAQSAAECKSAANCQDPWLATSLHLAGPPFLHMQAGCKSGGNALQDRCELAGVYANQVRTADAMLQARCKLMQSVCKVPPPKAWLAHSLHHSLHLRGRRCKMVASPVGAECKIDARLWGTV